MKDKKGDSKGGANRPAFRILWNHYLIEIVQASALLNGQTRTTTSLTAVYTTAVTATHEKRRLKQAV